MDVFLADARVYGSSCAQFPGHFPWGNAAGSGTSRQPGHPTAITDVSAGGPGRQEAEWSRGDTPQPQLHLKRPCFSSTWEHPGASRPSTGHHEDVHPTPCPTPAWSIALPRAYVLLGSFPHCALSRGKALILRPDILNPEIWTRLTVPACQPTHELSWRWIVA